MIILLRSCNEEHTNLKNKTMETGNTNNYHQDFAGHVDVFFKLDDELRGVSKEIKDLKSNKLSVEERIATHMHEHDIPETISSSGKIRVYKSKSSSPMNKALVEKSATELFGADQSARLMKYIEEKREVTEKIKIKRVASAPGKIAHTINNKKKKMMTPDISRE